MNHLDLKIDNTILYNKTNELVKVNFDILKLSFDNNVLFNELYSPAYITEEVLLGMNFIKSDKKSHYGGGIYKYGVMEAYFCLERDWRDEPSYHFGIEYTDSPFPHDDDKIYNFTFEIKYIHQVENVLYEILKYESDRDY